MGQPDGARRPRAARSLRSRLPEPSAVELGGAGDACERRSGQRCRGDRRRHGRAGADLLAAAQRHRQHPLSRPQSRRRRRAVGDLRAHGDAALAEGADRAGRRHSVAHLPRLVRGAVRPRRNGTRSTRSRACSGWTICAGTARCSRCRSRTASRCGASIRWTGCWRSSWRGGTRVLARQVVMATGREGLGRPRIPAFMRDVPRRFWAHTVGRHRLRRAARHARGRDRRRRLGDGQRRRGARGGLRGTAHAGPARRRCRASTSSRASAAPASSTAIAR